MTEYYKHAKCRTGNPSPNWNIFNNITLHGAQVSFQKRVQSYWKDCRNTEFTLSMCFLGMSEATPISLTWVPKYEPNNDDKKTQSNVDRGKLRGLKSTQITTGR